MGLVDVVGSGVVVVGFGVEVGPLVVVVGYIFINITSMQIANLLTLPGP